MNKKRIISAMLASVVTMSAMAAFTGCSTGKESDSKSAKKLRTVKLYLRS